MSCPAPLPFRIKVPDEESVELTGVRSVTTKVEGLLHIDTDRLILEWAVTRTVEEVGLSGVKEETDTFAPEEAEVPLDWLSGVSLAGGILFPRVVLRGRGLRVFDGIPGAKGPELALHYRRADRLLAVTVVRAVEALLEGPPLGDTTDPLLLRGGHDG
jgi:hypothetical protein